MNRFAAINIIEHYGDADFFDEPVGWTEYVEAFQYLIDSHTIGHLQGSYGRTACDLIEQGYCTSPQQATA
jgi:hypothetical protein